MKLSLIIAITILSFFIGYYLFAPPKPARVTINEVGPDKSGQQETRAIAEDSIYAHLISAVFAIFAGFLLVKKSENNVITLFSVAILSTIFGRYLGPLVIPSFLLSP